MEYRKKHLKPKINLTANVSDTFENPKLSETIDFFQQLRKNGYLYQVDMEIKC